MRRIFRIPGSGQKTCRPLGVNRGFFLFFLGLLVAFFALQMSSDLRAAPVNLVEIEWAPGLDADGDASQRPKVDDDDDDVEEGIQRRIREAGRRIRVAIEAGEITAEEGRERMQGLRKRIEERRARGDASRDVEAKEDPDDAIRRRIREARRRIGEAIDAGEITAEEGRERMEGMRRRIAKLQEKGDANVKGGDRASDGNARPGGDGARRIRQAVEDGVITAEQGRERLEGLRKRIAEDRAKGAGDDLSDGIRRRVGEARRRIGEAIEAGEITAEEGRERLGELRKRIAERQEKGAGGTGDWEAVTRRIEGAVESGVLTREEADDVYSGIKKRRAAAGDGSNKTKIRSDRKEPRVSGAALRERLEIAVETGRLTWDEARDRYIQAMEAGDGGRGAAARDRLNAGIELGRISEDEAVEKYIELMERPGAGKSDKKADQKFPKSKLPKSKLPKSQTITVEEYKKAAAKLKKAMEAGEMTEEQLKAKLEAWRRKIVD